MCIVARTPSPAANVCHTTVAANGVLISLFNNSRLNHKHPFNGFVLNADKYRIIFFIFLLVVPLLLLLCSCGSKGKGFLTVPEDGPEGTILIHNKEGPVPEDTVSTKMEYNGFSVQWITSDNFSLSFYDPCSSNVLTHVIQYAYTGFELTT